MTSLVSRLLRERPFASNAALSGAVIVLGDLAAQTIERGHRKEYDRKRLASMAVWGAVTAPPVVVWFRWLDRLFPPAAVSPRAILTKVLFHQLTLAPTMNALFFGYVAAVDRVPAPPARVLEKTLPVWRRKLQEDLLPVTARSLVWWLPVHVVNFLWVPPHARAVYTSCNLVVWTTYLSIVGHRKGINE